MRGFIRGNLSRRFLPPHEPNISVSMQTRLVLDTASRRVDSVPLWVYSILSPFRTSLCTCELKTSDLCGFIRQREIFPPPLLSSSLALFQVPFSLSGPLCVLAQ